MMPVVMIMVVMIVMEVTVGWPSMVQRKLGTSCRVVSV